MCGDDMKWTRTCKIRIWCMQHSWFSVLWFSSNQLFHRCVSAQSGMTYFFGLLPSLRRYGVKIVSRGFSIVLLITHFICDSTAVNLKHKNIFIELTDFCEITTMPLERPLKLVKKFLHFFGRMLCSFDELLAIWVVAIFLFDVCIVIAASFSKHRSHVR